MILRRKAYFPPMKPTRAWMIAIIAAVSFLGSHASPLPVSPTISIGTLGDPIISTDSASCIIPFTRMGNLILIQAKADTTTGYFVLDTGAPGLVLNITYFRH